MTSNLTAINRARHVALLACLCLLLGLLHSTPASAQASGGTATGTWAQAALPSNPGPRTTPLVWAESIHRLVLFGGWTLDQTDAEVWVFDVHAPQDGWTYIEVDGGPAARQLAGTVWDANSNRLVVFGGMGRTTAEGNRDPLGDTWALQFNPQGEALQWTLLDAGGDPSNALKPAPRWAAGAVYDAAGDRLVISGGTNMALSSAGQVTSLADRGGAYGDLWAFDLSDGGTGWAQLGGDDGPRLEHHHMVSDPVRGRVIASAHRTQPDHSGLSDRRDDTLHVYSFGGAWQRWENVAGTPYGFGESWGYSSALDAVVAIGRETEADEYRVYRFDLADSSTPEWRAIGGSEWSGPTLHGDGGGTIVTLADGSQAFVVFTAFNGGGREGVPGLYAFPLTGPDAGAWQELDPGFWEPPRFYNATLVDEATGDVYGVGGDGAGIPGGDPGIWRMDAETGRWSPVSPTGAGPPQAKGGNPEPANALLDPVGRRIVAFSTCPAAAFAFSIDDPQPAWERLTSVTDVLGVCGGRVVLDTVRNRAVVVGGSVRGLGGVEPNRAAHALDLSAPDPAWQLIPAVNAPGWDNEGVPMATYDARADQIVVLGYADRGSDPHDGDEWVTTVEALSLAGTQPQWRELQTGGTAPAARSGALLAVDTRRHELLVFGGYTSSGTATPSADGTTYGLTLSGTPTWHVVAAADGAPTGRVLGSAVYDTPRDRFLTLGGCAGNCWGSSAQRALSNELMALQLSSDPAVAPGSAPTPLLEAEPKGHRSAPQPASVHVPRPYGPAGPRPCATMLPAISLVGGTCLPPPASTTADPPVPVPCAPVPRVDSVCETTIGTYDNPAGKSGDRGYGADVVIDQVVDPVTGRVFVAGASWDDPTNGYGWVVSAFSAVGASLWSRRFDAIGFADTPFAAVLSPNGKQLFVTGSARHQRHDYDAVTIAYDTATGAQLWVSYAAGHRDLLESTDAAIDVAVSPDGTLLHVLAAIQDETRYETVCAPGGVTVCQERTYLDYDWNVITLDATTGHTLHTEALDLTPAGHHSSYDMPVALVASADGKRVHAAGWSTGATTSDLMLASLDVASGGVVWTSRIDRGSFDAPEAIALTPDGRTLMVTGGSGVCRTENACEPHFFTAAIDTADGSQRWFDTYAGAAALYSGTGWNVPDGITVSDDGERAYVTGTVAGQVEADDKDIATLAYGIATGVRLWQRTFTISNNDYAAAVAYDDSDNTVYVAGRSYKSRGTAAIAGVDAVLVGYDGSSGQDVGTAHRDLGSIDFFAGVDVDVDTARGSVVTAVNHVVPDDMADSADMESVRYPSFR